VASDSYACYDTGTQLPVELLQTILKMAPTTEEELKLRLFSGEMSQLGPAERFLKVLVDIPYALQRVETLLFMNSAQEEVSSIKESLATLEVNNYYFVQTGCLLHFGFFDLYMILCLTRVGRGAIWEIEGKPNSSSYTVLHRDI